MNKIKLGLFIITMFIIGVVSNSSVIAENNHSVLSNQTETEEFDISNWWWDEMQVFSDESTLHSYQPIPDIDSQGNIHVVWHDETDILGSDTDYDIFYKKWDVTTETWGTTELISTESTSHSDEPSIVIDTEDNLHVIWHDNTDILSCGSDWDIFYKMLDASTSVWGTTEVVSTESTADALDATFGIDQAGNIFVAWEDVTDDDLEADKDIYFKKKDAFTGLWSGAEDLSSVSNDASNDPHLVIDSTGNVHVAWIDSFNLDIDLDADVFYCFLDADTSTWSPIEDLCTVGTLDSDNVFLAVDSSDNIHVAYEDFSDYMGSGIGEKDVFYKYKVALTGNWTPTELVTIASTANSVFPHMTIDSTNKIHMVFQDATDIYEAGSDIDIFYTCKDSLTSDWIPQQPISTESTSSCVWGQPTIVIDGNGYYHVFWQDYTDVHGADPDSDIFYRKFVGPPQTPHLYTISPDPSITGNISLYWTEVAASDDYHIYRDEVQINSLTGLSAISITSENSFNDTILINGTYYYVVTSENEYGRSSISNVEFVKVLILPDIDIDLTAGNSSNLLPFISDELLAIVGSLLGLQILFFVIGLLLKKK